MYKIKYLICQDIVGPIHIQVVAIYNSFLNSWKSIKFKSLFQKGL